MSKTRFFTTEYLRSILSYDDCRVTSLVTRGRCPASLVYTSILITIDGHGIPATHVIWKLKTGDDVPDGMEVDHRDHNPRNMSWDNLRLATRQQQVFNRRLRKDSGHGLKGVQRQTSGRYQAIVRADGKTQWLGTYDTAEEAHQVYAEAVKKVHGEFSCTE